MDVKRVFARIMVDHARRLKPICRSKVHGRRSTCTTNQFQCLNKAKCIPREYYCNSREDCSDESDEKYCNANYCPENFYKCGTFTDRKCIPNEWICDGKTDCDTENDEKYCGTKLEPEVLRINLYNTQLADVSKWVTSQKILSTSEKWGSHVDKIALMFHFTVGDENASIKSEIAYELSIQLLSRLTRKKLKDIPSADLASYVNAFLVMCINPRDFHGYDIVQELRNRVDKENYTNPYVFLALCNAGETITESDKKKLTDTFFNKHRAFWTDMQGVVVMALACASKQPGNEVDSETLQEMTLELKQRQYRNGTVVNLATTALVMQALIATDSPQDPDNFDEVKAFDEIVRNKKPDGSFGDFMNTFLVAPVLACKSLVDINSDHCRYAAKDEISALEKLTIRSDPKIRVQYSLWIENEKNLERNLVLRVPQNMSLYGVMQVAAEIDTRFKFEYSVKDRKPYINTISGMRDNPLTGQFWFLYTIENDEPTLSNKSPADIIPQDNGHYVMWYRRGTWTD